MTQDAESGREGRDFGMVIGRALAAQIGTLLSKTASVLRLPDGRTATLRVARGSNTTFGCLHTVRDQVEVILCAHTADGKTFDLWEVPVPVWTAKARPASSGSKLYGRLSQMSRSAVQSLGTSKGRIILRQA